MGYSSAAIQLVFLLFIITFIGCKAGPKRFADDRSAILDKPKMQALIKDIHIADGTIKAQNFPDDSTKFYARCYYKAILAKHNVKLKTFKQSLAYYVENPDVMITMYKPIMQEIKEDQQTIDTSVSK